MGEGQGQSGQAIKLFQITPYVNDFHIHSTIPVPDSLYRRLEKLVLHIPFSDTTLSSVMTLNLQSYPTTVLKERM